jgi:hypothetical protein
VRAVFQILLCLSDGDRTTEAIVTHKLQYDVPRNTFGSHLAWRHHRFPVRHIDPNRIALGPQFVDTATARVAKEFGDECIRADHYNLICVYRARTGTGGRAFGNGFPDGGNIGCTSIVGRPSRRNRDEAKHDYKPWPQA